MVYKFRQGDNSFLFKIAARFSVNGLQLKYRKTELLGFRLNSIGTRVILNFGPAKRKLDSYEINIVEYLD